MTIQIFGDAPGFATRPASGINATLYRFELVDGALIRERPGDVKPRAERKRYLIDVLLNEDEVGRYLIGVRGFVVPRQNGGSTVRERPPFEVTNGHMLAIGENLGVGPHLRAAPRLATLDGRRTG